MNHLPQEREPWDFPGDPVLKILSFKCWGCRFDPWSGTKIPHAMWHGQKKRDPD